MRKDQWRVVFQGGLESLSLLFACSLGCGFEGLLPGAKTLKAVGQRVEGDLFTLRGLATLCGVGKLRPLTDAHILFFSGLLKFY